VGHRAGCRAGAAGQLAIGLVVGIIQAATSVNEQTLTFVPKLAITALVLVCSAHR
jgi:flagellar biosynthesis protein FliQ